MERKRQLAVGNWQLVEMSPLARLGLYFVLGLVLISCGEVSTITTVEVTREVMVEVPVTVQVPVVQTVEIVLSGDTIMVTQEANEVAAPIPVATPEVSPQTFSLIFPPTYAEGVINFRGQALADALNAATGETFQLVQAASMGEAVQALCDNPSHSIAFLPANAYVLANEQCQAQARAVGVKFDVPYETNMLLVIRQTRWTPEVLPTLPDLRFGYVADGSVKNEFAPQTYLAQLGVTIASENIVAYPSDSAAILGLMNGEVSMITADFKPPIMPFNATKWTLEENPEVWLSTDALIERSGQGYIIANGLVENGGYRVRDARAVVFDTNPNVFLLVDIIDLLPTLPNDGIIFGGGMPLANAAKIESAIIDFSNSEACAQSICSPDFFAWQSVSSVSDGDYNWLRQVVQSQGLTAERLLP